IHLLKAEKFIVPVSSKWLPTVYDECLLVDLDREQGQQLVECTYPFRLCGPGCEDGAYLNLFWLKALDPACRVGTVVRNVFQYSLQQLPINQYLTHGFLLGRTGRRG